MINVLTVDDSRTMRTILCRFLHGLGYETAEAAHGREALDWLAANPLPDIAFVDWNMPEMTGIEFVNEARKQSALDPLRIVMVTSENEISFVAPPSRRAPTNSS